MRAHDATAERILLVAANEEFRNEAAETLRQAGLTSDAAEAPRTAGLTRVLDGREACDARHDLVISFADVRMPTGTSLSGKSNEHQARV